MHWYNLSNLSLTLYQSVGEYGNAPFVSWNTLNPDEFIFLNCAPTLKLIFVVPVIFKLDGVEPIKEFILLKFELILPNDDNILVPETVNADKTEILSDVILLHVKSYAPW